MNQTGTIEQETQTLKACIAALRSKGGRRRFPESIKKRVLALQQTGRPVKPLAAELGLAASQIYDWAKAEQNPVPRVLQVEPPARFQGASQALPPAALQLRWGGFCVTVAVEG